MQMTVEHDIKRDIEEDDGGLKLAGGTRHRDEMMCILVCILKQPCSEKDFGH